MKDAITLSSLSLVERLRCLVQQAARRAVPDLMNLTPPSPEEVDEVLTLEEAIIRVERLADEHNPLWRARAEAAEAKLAALSAPLPGAETSDGEALVNALDNPPPPTEKLRNLMAEKPPWGAAPPTMDGFGIGWREVPGGRIKATMTDEQDKTDA